MTQEITVDLRVDKLDVDSEQFFLPISDLKNSEGRALWEIYQDFIQTDPACKAAQMSAGNADSSMLDILPKLCKALKDNGFSRPQYVIFKGFKKDLKNCGEFLDELVHSNGASSVASSLLHCAILVNGLILDPSFMRLGDCIEKTNNRIFKEFACCWDKFYVAPSYLEASKEALLGVISNAMLEETSVSADASTNLLTAFASSKRRRKESYIKSITL